MPFDPAFPATDALLISSEFRAQFTGLFDLIQTVPVGPAGPTGPAGASVNAAVIDGVATGNPGESATATVALNAETLHFSFSIPRGEVGAQGATGSSGADGAAGQTGLPFTSFGIGTVTSLDPGQNATASAGFDGSVVRMSFGIPRGDPGATGAAGGQGPAGGDGPPFTSFEIGSVTTLNPGDSATVSAFFNGFSVQLSFGIPRGDRGNDGGQGPQGSQGPDGPAGPAGPVGPQGPTVDVTGLATKPTTSPFTIAISDPPTQADVQSVVDALNFLLSQLRA